MNYLFDALNSLNDLVLKMTWLYQSTGWLVESVFGLSLSSTVGSSVHFFIYDVIKIFILLSVLIFSISYLQSYFPPERTKKILSRYSGVSSNIFAALLGTLTPFCSCSSIPIFIGFSASRLPIGTTFSFLISSPLVDLASIILLASIFNWRIALAYVIVGLILAVVSGTLISMLSLEDQIEPFVYQTRFFSDAEAETLSRWQRLEFSLQAVRDIYRKVWLYVVLGVGIGALIHNVVPEVWISNILGADKWYSLPFATVVGIPMYADIFGTLPIAQALVGKGVGVGTALAFMMAVTALSLPSLIMLKQVIRPKLMVIFVSLVTSGIIVIGYVFNAFGHLLI
jgi:uncharacterized membrane protein YraQ (UPF0718 family)